MITFKDNKIYTYNISTGKIKDLTDTINISKSNSENFVGCYADIDADGIVDGVIFADLLTGSIKETQEHGTNGNGTYTIQTVSENNLKDYYIIKENYQGPFGTNNVLSPKGYGCDRFYVMSLNDLSTTSNERFSFYNTAYNSGHGTMLDYNTTTSSDFGSGITNTINMMERWNNKRYGEQNEKDIWGNISEQVNSGWFVPSREELAAFYNELEIIYSTNNNVSKSYNYWSSSQYDQYGIWLCNFNGFGIGWHAEALNKVRLATTF